ncbi:protein lifeguard 2-like [Euwallacea fornicatus]|uniref:protein lifeguard 2-like n=1 Tax=Euwallacea fornicatus TaxID=995702 RepID=UPI00338E0C84
MCPSLFIACVKYFQFLSYFMSQNQNKLVVRVRTESNDYKPSVKDNSTLQASNGHMAKPEELSKSGNIASAKNEKMNVYTKPQISVHSTESENPNTLNLFDENEVQDARGVIKNSENIISNGAEIEGNMKYDENFATMEVCLKEKMANSYKNTMFSRGQWMQRVRAVTGEAPPPHERVPLPNYQITNSDDRNQASQYQTSGDGASDDLTWSSYLYSSLSSEIIRIHHNFVRKVFAILGSQLLFTFSMILLTLFHEPTKKFVAKDLVLLSVMTFMIFGLYLVLICYNGARRIFPLNFILLALLTISMSYLGAAASCKTESKTVLITVGGTCAVCIVVSLLAFQTWFDITKWSFILIMATVVVLIFSLIVTIVSIFTRQMVLYLVYSGIIVTLFSVFLMFDMQCILRGRRVQLFPEEYIYGALTLYVDIILIFTHMLNLVRACS